MKHYTFRVLVLLLAICSPIHILPADDAARGPLQVLGSNPRYFTDGTGNAVLLVGSHTWNSLSDMGTGDPPEAFDFDAYLMFLERHNHNFIRLWRWESATWDLRPSAAYTNNKETLTVTPHPWRRTGDANALDGDPKFDLSAFNPEYFQRLRKRVEAAGQRGIYVSIMLFEGWDLQHSREDWKRHPFHRENNINHIDGDPDGDGLGIETHTLEIPEVTRMQEAYVRKVIDTVNDLDNVLYEIANETGAYSTAWQYHLIDSIREEERTRAKQHPVGMTFQYSREAATRGTNRILFDSPADWISPNSNAPEDYNYKSNPPASDGSKVILSDTDHLWGIGGDVDWVWKSFTRGHNLLFMDPYDNSVLGKASADSWDLLRANLGHVRRVSQRFDLTPMQPRDDLASTGFCLANNGHSYVVYVPDSGKVEIDLSNASGSYSVEWLAPSTGLISDADPIQGGVTRALSAPSPGPAVLLLSKIDDN